MRFKGLEDGSMSEIDHGTSESRGHNGPKLLKVMMAVLIVALMVLTAPLMLAQNASANEGG